MAVSVQTADWSLVCADAERIKEALAILIDNAVVYNKEEGKIEIRTAKERGKLLIRISNTGLYLDAEAQEHLFRQSFFRTKEAKRVNPTGMGVGLLVAKTILTAHRGTITLESSEEERTTFVVALPIAG